MLQRGVITVIGSRTHCDVGIYGTLYYNHYGDYIADQKYVINQDQIELP